MSDGKIYIVVTDKMPEDKGVATLPSPKQPKQENNLLLHYANDNIISTAKSIINKSVMYNLQNYGNFTGDYIAQTHINESLQFAQTIGHIGLSAWSGFVASGGNPLGAVIGASLSIINTGVNAGFNMLSMRVQNSKTNYEIAQLRDRAGLNSLRDGSRGTEN